MKHHLKATADNSSLTCKLYKDHKNFLDHLETLLEMLEVADDQTEEISPERGQSS